MVWALVYYIYPNYPCCAIFPLSPYPTVHPLPNSFLYAVIEIGSHSLRKDLRSNQQLRSYI